MYRTASANSKLPLLSWLLSVHNIFQHTFVSTERALWSCFNEKYLKLGLALYITIHFIVSMAQQPLLGQSRLTVKDSRSHSDTPQGLLRKSDQPEAGTTT